MFPLDDSRYKVDYAKTGRAKCYGGCKKTIDKGTLRIARMVQAVFGMKESWYHEGCFFKKNKPKSVSEISGFNKLENGDQERLIKKLDIITEASMVVCRKDDTNGQSSKRSSAEVDGPLDEFIMEYSKHFNHKCKHCDIKICKGDVRISKTVRDTGIARKRGYERWWYHVMCFAKARKELHFFVGGEMLPGFNSLSEEDQQNVRDIIRPLNPEEVPCKKIKTDPEEVELLRVLNEQNDKYQNYKRELEKLPPKIIESLLRANHQIVTKNKRQRVELLADCMAFGALLRCPQCNGQLMMATHGYKCTGNLSAYSGCPQLSACPARAPLRVPPALAALPPLRHYTPTVAVRVFRPQPQQHTVKKEVSNLPLKNLQFFIYGRELKDKKDSIKRRIFNLGGLVVSKLTDTTAAVVSTPTEINRMNKIMKDIHMKGIQVVEESFLTQIDSVNGSVENSLMLICESNIANWGSDPRDRVPRAVVEGKPVETSGNYYVKTSKSKKILKDGVTIECAELAETSHVYRDSDGQQYSETLSLTDAQRSRNLSYTIQLLASEVDDRYYVYTAWGQIGTEGKSNIDYFYNLEDAVAKFKSKFFEKTKNRWEDRHCFIKYPWKYYPHDVNYEEANSLSMEVDFNSDLPVSVQRLVQKIFDINTMKRTMKEFQLDMEKSPLGKLSQKDITEGYKILAELIKYLEKGKSGRAKILDASSRFYTLIPHKASSGQPPLLDSIELVLEKVQVLGDLKQMNLAFDCRNADSRRNELEELYRKLNTEISPLEETSMEFGIIKEYVQSTHSEIHSNYSLEIEQVFKIVRAGEDDRYKPFKKLHNRRLLWHGTRVTNFVGILSQGLIITPPDTPLSGGEMFGKGIYFADMLSKSANYCRADLSHSVGLLLLCEVALGNMMECTEGKHVTELPADVHSVMGLGRSGPEPARTVALPDGTLVPLGPPVSYHRESQLEHNEYVVYNPAQINVKYLLQLKFNNSTQN